MIELLVSIGISLAAFAVLLAFIVFIHEYGHFKVARLCGIRVDTFSIGFGPAMLKWTDKKGTVWKIAAIPLGGFVKFFGDANAASAGTSADEHEDHPMTTQFNSEKDRLAAVLTEEEKKVCFHFKPVWQRMAVVAAGPFSNFILGAVIFAILFATVGTQEITPVVGRVQAETAADEAGFEAGDKILTLNGRRVRDFTDMATRVKLSSGETLTFEVERDGRELTLIAVPKRVTQTDGFGNEVRVGQLGIVAFTDPVIGVVIDDSTAAKAGLEAGDRVLSVDGQPIFTWSDIGLVTEGRAGETVPVIIERDGQEMTFDVEIYSVTVTDTEGNELSFDTLGLGPKRDPLQRLGPAAAAKAGVEQVGEVLGVTVRYLGRLISFKEDPRQLGGPVKIAKYAGQAAEAGFNPAYEIPLTDRILISLQTFINLAALISVSIGFMNILPIPVLDGGHLVYYAYEAIAGRPLSDRIQGIGFRIGLAIVGTFMIFVIVNDVVGLF
ncbi:RIP metalloprotease RseP [Parvularcula marina]|uniref:RIP metalloprotease RseP n=1 Tax=Parvularcula marina TaxID=2292771 RepID=UPI0035157CE1